MGERIRKSINLTIETLEKATNFQTWESITEDAEGLIDLSVQDAIQRARRKRAKERAGKSKVRLGMMRHLYLVLDMADNMNMQVKRVPLRDAFEAFFDRT